MVKILYASVINSARVVGPMRKFESSAWNTNASQIFINSGEDDLDDHPVINIYSNTDWRGFSGVIFRGGDDGVLFYGGFHADTMSDDFFEQNFRHIKNKVELIDSLAMHLKDRPKSASNSWGERNPISMQSKLLEIHEKRKRLSLEDYSTNFSTTQYYSKAGNLIFIPTEHYKNGDRNFLGGYADFLKFQIPSDELAHNECHISSSFYHIESVCIALEDVQGQTARQRGELTDLYNFEIIINSKYMTYWHAKSLQVQINKKRQEILNSVAENGNKQAMKYCIEMEISKVSLVFEKILFCKKILDYHFSNPNLRSNSIMKLAFKSKKIKEPRFNGQDPRNYEIWIKKQIDYLKNELEIYHLELESLGSHFGIESLREFSDQLNARTSQEYEEGLKKITEFKEQKNLDQALCQRIQEKIIAKLQIPIPITIYDKHNATIEEISPQLVTELSNLSILNSDPNIAKQFAQNDFFEQLLHCKESYLMSVILNEERGQKNILYYAARHNNPQAIRKISQMLKAKFRPHIHQRIIDDRDPYDNTPLHIASRYGHLESIEALLEVGADINLINSQEDKKNGGCNTALHEAAIYGQIGAIKMLLKAGANIDKVNDYCYSPLDVAIVCGNLETVEFLISAGARINKDDYDPNHVSIENEYGDTPLHLALYYNQIEIFKILLEAGADINKTEKYGNSVLHYAVGIGDLEVIRTLVERGADINKVNIANRHSNNIPDGTPLDLAIHFNKTEIIDFLKSAGALVKAPNQDLRQIEILRDSGDISSIQGEIQEQQEGVSMSPPKIVQQGSMNQASSGIARVVARDSGKNSGNLASCNKCTIS
jgi:ankyrin repeat protein